MGAPGPDIGQFPSIPATTDATCRRSVTLSRNPPTCPVSTVVLTRIVDAYVEATQGTGTLTVDGQQVDEATHKIARDVLARAKAADVQ